LTAVNWSVPAAAPILTFCQSASNYTRAILTFLPDLTRTSDLTRLRVDSGQPFGGISVDPDIFAGSWNSEALKPFLGVPLEELTAVNLPKLGISVSLRVLRRSKSNVARFLES
jgi:hypothetical protein